MFGGLLEVGDVHVADSGTDEEMNVDRVARNFIADDVEFQRLLGTFAQHGDANGSSAGAFEHVRDFACAEVVGWLAIDRDDDVAGVDASAESRAAKERRHHNHFIVAGADCHADAVVFTVLLFSHERILLRIEEAGMRIEDVQHAWNSAVIDGLIGIDRFGVILLDDAVDLGEATEAGADVGYGVGGGASVRLLGKDDAQETAGRKYYEDEEQRKSGTVRHLKYPQEKGPKSALGPSHTIERSIACKVLIYRRSSYPKVTFRVRTAGHVYIDAIQGACDGQERKKKGKNAGNYVFGLPGLNSRHYDEAHGLW